jgi:transposase-like protein
LATSAGDSRQRRVSMREAADILGVSKEAIRKRVIRGTLRSEMGEDGRRYVYIAAGGDDPATPEPSPAFISELREHNATLREQLQAERQAHAEARRLLAAALERIPPQLEAPQKAPEAPETAPDSAEEGEPRPGTAEPQEPVERRSWWRRVFGG